jgi:mRNA-degrading endonuclease RelE of RelBE toxin-antitoxin system
VLDDIDAFEQDPFRGLVKPLKGRDHKGLYRKVSGRYRIIFKATHPIHAVDVLAVLLRNEKTLPMTSVRCDVNTPAGGTRRARWAHCH